MMIVCTLFEIAKAQAQFYKADGTRNRTGMNHIGVNNIEFVKWVRKRHQKERKQKLRLVKDIE